MTSLKGLVGKNRKKKQNKTQFFYSQEQIDQILNSIEIIEKSLPEPKYDKYSIKKSSHSFRFIVDIYPHNRLKKQNQNGNLFQNRTLSIIQHPPYNLVAETMGLL